MAGNDEIYEFINNQNSKNTICSNNAARNALVRYMKSVNDNREPCTIQSSELDNILCGFFMHVEKKKGGEYEPDCLSVMHRGIQRYLKEKKYAGDILKDKSFSLSRQVLASKRKALKKKGFGNKPNACRELSEEEIDLFFKEEYFGLSTPESTQRTVWWCISINFGFRGRDEARQICWGDVELKHDASRKLDYLVWRSERTRKRAQGLESENARTFDPTMYETKSERCPIMYFKVFAHHRPAESKTSESPFFLNVKHGAPRSDRVWYLNRPMGKNYLGNILTTARKQFNLEGRKVANHSVRKTGIGRLLDANVAEIFVAQHSGMSSSDSLKSYKAPNKNHQKSMSDIVNSESNCGISINSNLSSTESAKSMFAGAVFNSCTFNWNVSEQ